MRKSELKKLAARLDKINSTTKGLYQEKDLIEAKLIAAVSASETKSLPIGEGRLVRLVDNFLDRDGRPKNIAWKQCGVQRFKIEVVTVDPVSA